MKVLLFILLIGLIYYVIQKNAKSALQRCDRCKGKGFWTSLRGERNHCKPCNGTGELQ